MNNTLKKILICAFAIAASSAAWAQKNQFNPIETGVTSLSIAPDARGASMGDLGAATDPDAYSQFWNPSKYAFCYSKAAVSLSYTPWLRKLVNDIFLADLSGYYKIGRDDNQAISASLRYFSLGEVTSGSDESGAPLQSLNPYEMSFDVGYSRMLSEKFSMGVVFRYIYTALGFSDAYAGDQMTGASAFAADISGYYTSYPIIGRNECQWSWGWNISNIGTKVSYNDDNPAFMPTNLKIGTMFKFPLADYHNLAIGLDLNKLLVPLRPRESEYDMNTEDGQIQYEEALQDWKDMSPITAIFKSFTDAPGGFSEEMKEINVSLGAEYSYNDQFFIRAGYYYENEFKGNRKYFSMGAGFSLNVVRLDASYMLATAQSSPLDQTLRFSLTFDMDGIKDIFGRR